MKFTSRPVSRKTIIGVSVLAAAAPLTLGGFMFASNASAQEILNISRRVQYLDDKEADGFKDRPSEILTAFVQQECDDLTEGDRPSSIYFTGGIRAPESVVFYHWRCIGN